MQTSKSVQLTDGNKVNISPMTDLMSIYYEVLDDKNIVSRKYIYNDFPCGVTLTNKLVPNIQVSKNLSAELLLITNDDKIQYNNKGTLEDILISNVTTEKVKGTNYNMLISTNYNLSEILYNYESKFAFDASFYDVSKYAFTLSTDILNYVHTAENIIDTSIKIQNTSINYLARTINNLNNTISSILQTYQQRTSFDYSDLSYIVNSNALVSNKIYPLVYIPKNANTNIEGKMQNIEIVNDIYSYYILYLRAISPNKFDKQVQNIVAVDAYDNVYERSWEIEFDFNENKITWMKDNFGNEAPYDFKHLVAYVNNVSMFTFSDLNNNDMSLTGNVHHNAIKKYVNCTYMPIFKSSHDICYNECDIDCPVLVIGLDLCYNNIKNSSIIMNYQNNPTLDYMKNMNIINTSMYIANTFISGTQSYNTFENNRFNNVSLYIDNVGVSISNCTFSNVILSQGIIQHQYTILYVDIQNSDLTLSATANMKNDIIIGISNKHPYHMFSLVNNFITSYDMCASTFIQLP